MAANQQQQQQQQTQRKAKTMMLYGESGDTKTSQLYHLARYIIKATGKKIRLISADGGGYEPFESPCPDPFFEGKSLVESGYVDIFDISYRKTALADLRRLAEGYWPINAKIKATGRVVPKGYFKNDERCLTSPEAFDNIAAYLVEGAASISTLLLNHISDQDGGLGFKHSFEYEEEGYKVSGLQEGHYGIVQKELYRLQVHGFGRLPVDYVIWTSLVGKGVDKRTDKTIYGPKAAGDAITYAIPQWFGDCIHISQENVELEDKVVIKKVAWFRQHPDKDTGIPYLCKARITPELYQGLLRKFPNGYVPLGFKRGLDVYVEALEGLHNATTETEKATE